MHRRAGCGYACVVPGCLSRPVFAHDEASANSDGAGLPGKTFNPLTVASGSRLLESYTLYYSLASIFCGSSTVPTVFAAAQRHATILRCPFNPRPITSTTCWLHTRYLIKPIRLRARQPNGESVPHLSPLLILLSRCWQAHHMAKSNCLSAISAKPH